MAAVPTLRLRLRIQSVFELRYRLPVHEMSLLFGALDTISVLRCRLSKNADTAGAARPCALIGLENRAVPRRVRTSFRMLKV
jgi:hypothetical protein